MRSLYECMLISARAQEYMESRAIPLNLMVELGLGWAPRGHWPHYFEKDGKRKLCRQAHPGRMVFPHTDLSGRIINLYGRAASADCQREQRHDHLPGNRGIFNAAAINDARASGLPLWACEGPFDALSALASGAKHAIAIFGLKGWREEWMDGLEHVVIAFDSDGPGQDNAKALKRRISGQIAKVEIFDGFGGAKDLNEAWMKGHLQAEVIA
jgi:DNA primase